MRNKIKVIIFFCSLSFVILIGIYSYQKTKFNDKHEETDLGTQQYEETEDVPIHGECDNNDENIISVGDYDDIGTNSIKSGFVNDDGYYVFGRYEQDNDLLNGPEQIEWEILAENDNCILLISKYVLDCMEYNTMFEDVTWEDSTLRGWLNNYFLNTAFSAAEREIIIENYNLNDDNPRYSTKGCNDTVDMVFCLSATELSNYYDYNSWYTKEKPYKWKNDGGSSWSFGYSEQLIVPATKYAINQGLWIYTITDKDYNEGDGYYYELSHENYGQSVVGKTGTVWWLRSPGCTQSTACCVDYNGCSGFSFSKPVNDAGRGVRPAIYISNE